MAFDLTVPYTPYNDMVCQQGNEFYVVRIDPITGEGPVPFVSVGPYATAAEALQHIGDLPPPVMPPPPHVLEMP